MVGRQVRIDSPSGVHLEFHGQGQSTVLTEVVLLDPVNPGERLFTQAEWIEIGTLLDLSDRLLCVAILLVEGHSREEIAQRMRKIDGSSVSKETVRVYLDRLFEKANVRNRFEFAVRLLRICRELAKNPDEDL